MCFSFLGPLTFMLVLFIIISINVKGGIAMPGSYDILKILKKNNGMITTNMVSEAGISRGNLKHLADTGVLEKVSRGVYVLPSTFNDELFELQSRYKKGIYSLGTALYLHGLTDRTPLQYEMTFPATYNLSSPKQENIRCSNTKDSFYRFGIVEVSTPYDHYVKCYDAEKTLCDILRPHNAIDIEIITEAFKQYVMRENKNLYNLSIYADLLHVEAKVQAYLEVLL